LAEPQTLAFGLPLRIELRATLPRTPRERRERVLEHLLEREELEQTEVDRRVEAESALVRTDRAAHLDAEPAADLDVAAIVDPRDPEHHDAFRLDRALEDLRIDVARVPSERQFDRLGDLLDRPMELRLAGVLCDELRHQPVHVITHGNGYLRAVEEKRRERERQASLSGRLLRSSGALVARLPHRRSVRLPRLPARNREP